MKIKALILLFILSIIHCFASNLKYDPDMECVFLDVRSIEEACVDHLDTTRANPSVLVPYDSNFKDKVDLLSIYKKREIIIFCKSGHRAGLAKAILEEAGFEHVENIKTLQNAKDFYSKLRAKKLELNERIKKEYTHLIENAGIEDDVFLLIDNADADRLGDVLDRIKRNPDDFGEFINPIFAYIYASRTINSYYINHLHPFHKDIDTEDLPENLKSAYADFKIQQKKSLEMNAAFLRLIIFASSKGDLEPSESSK